MASTTPTPTVLHVLVAMQTARHEVADAAMMLWEVRGTLADSDCQPLMDKLWSACETLHAAEHLVIDG